jgi:hypothetical protein
MLEQLFYISYLKTPIFSSPDFANPPGSLVVESGEVSPVQTGFFFPVRAS